jgi:hypothetical protein
MRQNVILLLFQTTKNNSTRTLIYMKTDITTSLCFAWQEAVLCSLLFQFALRHGPWVLVHCNAVKIRSLLTMYKGDGNVFLQLTDSITITSNFCTAYQCLLNSASQFEGTTNSPHFLFIYIFFIYLHATDVYWCSATPSSLLYSKW